MYQLLQNPDPPKVDESLLGSRIEYLSEFELDYEREELIINTCVGVVV